MKRIFVNKGFANITQSSKSYCPKDVSRIMCCNKGAATSTDKEIALWSLCQPAHEFIRTKNNTDQLRKVPLYAFSAIPLLNKLNAIIVSSANIWFHLHYKIEFISIKNINKVPGKTSDNNQDVCKGSPYQAFIPSNLGFLTGVCLRRNEHSQTLSSQTPPPPRSTRLAHKTGLTGYQTLSRLSKPQSTPPSLWHRNYLNLGIFVML